MSVHLRIQIKVMSLEAHKCSLMMTGFVIYALASSAERACTPLIAPG